MTSTTTSVSLSLTVGGEFLRQAALMLALVGNLKKRTMLLPKF